MSPVSAFFQRGDVFIGLLLLVGVATQQAVGGTVQPDADLAAETPDGSPAGSAALGLEEVVGQFLVGPAGAVQTLFGRPVDDPTPDRVGQGVGDGRLSPLGLAAAQPVEALVEVGVEPALDGAWGDGQVGGDVLVRSSALGQADDEEAVADLGVGFLAKGHVEPLGFLRRKANANHRLSVPSK